MAPPVYNNSKWGDSSQWKQKPVANLKLPWFIQKHI
jgi:hypothetical protein